MVKNLTLKSWQQVLSLVLLLILEGQSKRHLLMLFVNRDAEMSRTTGYGEAEGFLFLAECPLLINLIPLDLYTINHLNVTFRQLTLREL